MDCNKIFKTVEEQLDSPSEQLLSIRQQLKDGKDKYLNKLTTLELNVTEEEYSILERYSALHNSTVEEVIWLYLETLIDYEES